jgi:type II secretory pathway pseudopilin PulG
MARYTRHGRGYTYLGFMIALAIIAGVMAATAQVFATSERRAKEEDLLFAGNQFRHALAAYYRNSPGGAVKYPTKLEDLLEDNRYPEARHYLRKIYTDPMTGNSEWGLTKLADGSIIGVHSLSDQEPIKQGGFRPADTDLQNKHKYSEWEFMYVGVESAPAGTGTGTGTQQQRPSNSGRGRNVR